MKIFVIPKRSMTQQKSLVIVHGAESEFVRKKFDLAGAVSWTMSMNSLGNAEGIYSELINRNNDKDARTIVSTRHLDRIPF